MLFIDKRNVTTLFTNDLVQEYIFKIVKIMAISQKYHAKYELKFNFHKNDLLTPHTRANGGHEKCFVTFNNYHLLVKVFRFSSKGWIKVFQN